MTFLYCLLAFIALVFVVFIVSGPNCDHEDEVIDESEPYPDVLEYWTNPLVGDLVRMKIIRVDRTFKCKKCGREYVEHLKYRNNEERRRDTPFSLVARLEL